MTLFRAKDFFEDEVGFGIEKNHERGSPIMNGCGQLNYTKRISLRRRSRGFCFGSGEESGVGFGGEGAIGMGQ